MASAPTPQNTHRRPAIFAACAVLAAILNASAIGIAVNASSLGHGAIATGPIERLRGAAMMLVAGREASAPPTDGAGAHAIPIIEAPPRRQTPHAPPARTAHTSVPGETAAQPVVFYSYREVDNPAFPESDWNLDVDSLDAIGVQRLVFEVLVSDHGEIVGSSVLAPAELPDEARRDLEKRIAATPMLPAQRAGRLVASVRRIELFVADAPLDAPLDPAARRP